MDVADEREVRDQRLEVRNNARRRNDLVDLIVYFRWS
jgi:hypothetical protein